MRTNGANHLAAALQSAMRKNNMKAIDVSRKTTAMGRTLAGSYLSRVINGDQGFVTNGDLEVLAKAISSDPADRADIYRGRLFDQMPNEAFTLLSIEPRKGKGKNSLTPRGQKALHYLLDRKNPQIEATLVELARLIGMK